MFKLDSQIEQIITNLPELKRHNSSILEIAGFPHYENVISNFLAFYFDFNEKHGLGDLFVKSLFSALKLGKEYIPSNNINVHKEVVTPNNKRIDLIIELDEYAIAIENKIHHTLKNPLKDYENYMRLNYPDKKQLGVILSIHPVQVKARSFFKSILYHKYCQILSQQLGTYITISNSFHASFVTDFLTTLNNLKKGSTMNDEVIEYMSKHYEEFVKIQEMFTIYFKEIHQKLNTLEQLLNLKKYTKSQSRWKAEWTKNRLYNVSVYNLKERYGIKNLHLKIRITPKGWSIELWGTNELPEDKKVLLSNPNDFQMDDKNVEYVIMKEAKYQTHPSEFKDFIEKSIKELYQIELY